MRSPDTISLRCAEFTSSERQRRTMATTDSKSESAIEASLEPDQRQAFRELIDDYNAAAGCIRKVGGAASNRVSLPPWSGADGGGRQTSH